MRGGVHLGSPMEGLEHDSMGERGHLGVTGSDTATDGAALGGGIPLLAIVGDQ